MGNFAVSIMQLDQKLSTVALSLYISLPLPLPLSLVARPFNELSSHLLPAKNSQWLTNGFCGTQLMT